MANLIAASLLLGAIAAAVFHLRREKKRGAACIGCPYAKQCGGKCTGKHTL